MRPSLQRAPACPAPELIHVTDQLPFVCHKCCAERCGGHAGPADRPAGLPPPADTAAAQVGCTGGCRGRPAGGGVCPGAGLGRLLASGPTRLTKAAAIPCPGPSLPANPRLPGHLPKHRACNPPPHPPHPTHPSFPCLACSELHARCCVHPPSELMGLALREVLPLQWQQEWRRMQGGQGVQTSVVSWPGEGSAELMTAAGTRGRPAGPHQQSGVPAATPAALVAHGLARRSCSLRMPRPCNQQNQLLGLTMCLPRLALQRTTARR